MTTIEKDYEDISVASLEERVKKENTEIKMSKRWCFYRKVCAILNTEVVV